MASDNHEAGKARPSIPISHSSKPSIESFFLFHDTPTTEIYTLSLHDALPTSPDKAACSQCPRPKHKYATCSRTRSPSRDRKSTRLNSSHMSISYAVFCLKKKSRALVLHIGSAMQTPLEKLKWPFHRTTPV